MFVLLALPWLAFCAWHDLRTRTVPPSLTIPSLMIAITWHGLNENWPLAILAVSLTILDDLPWRWRGFLGGVQTLLLVAATILGGIEAVLLGLVLIGVWLLWKLNRLGGADAQVIFTLSLFFGLPIILPLAIGTGLQAGFQKLRRKETMPAMLGILTGASIYAIALLLQ
ncbi:MAG: prepilin peptidase [Bacteroidetes bacterium]|nr:prepilin peptidase [Bacteroidota bacterium]